MVTSPRSFLSVERPGRAIVSMLCLVALPWGCGHRPATAGSGSERPLRADGIVELVGSDGARLGIVSVEIAETPEARARGLMGRTSLRFGEGMLFLYDRAEPRSFWMRDTPLSLDILFVGDDGRVASIAERTAPLSDPLHGSGGPVRLVLEVPAGFVAHAGVRVGTRVRWAR